MSATQRLNLKGHLGASGLFLEIFSNTLVIKLFLAFYLLFLSTNNFLKMPDYAAVKILNRCQKGVLKWPRFPYLIISVYDKKV